MTFASHQYKRESQTSQSQSVFAIAVAKLFLTSPDKRALKCSEAKCSVYVHKKCFDIVAKWFLFDTKKWCCRVCAEEKKVKPYLRSASTSDPGNDAEIAVLKKEVDCLIREKELITTLAAEGADTVKILKKRVSDLEAVRKVSDSSNPESPSGKKLAPISYSQAVKSTNNPYLIIKPADGSLNVDITKAKLTKSGFLISCNNDADIKSLKSTLESGFGNKYTIVENTKLRPRLLIQDIPSDYIKNKDTRINLQLVDDFIDTLIFDNNLNCTLSDVKVCKTFFGKNSINVVIELAPLPFKTLLKKGYVFICWNQCRIQEQLSVVRCFKCCKFSHMKKDCRSDIYVCPKCSEPHEVRDCKSTVTSCPNCAFYNNKFKTNYNTDHQASSYSCSVFRVKLQNLKNSINYD
ncbi:unnamed protein product [Callosobruchus maculatus]|uniref:CCHC-type domain-containing protein n=1 Tax=Callosobruchus maculatus TaxID=64391 RepID=A0A653BGX6_CALMS|nr:unnamed protein product [Callosobruchus maculatus]